MNNQGIEKELIKKMLTGRLSPEEQQQLNRLKDQPGFQELFHAVLDEQGGELEISDDDVTNAFTGQKLGQFHELLKQQKEEATETEKRVISLSTPAWKTFLPYAAIITAVISGLLFWISNTSKNQQEPAAQPMAATIADSTPIEKLVQYTEHLNKGKQRLKVKLPDGSVVTIGSKSRIRYAAVFTTENRELYLDGEAFFEVKKDPARPFIVYTGDVHTQVLGTSFKVVAFPGSPVEVAVVTGKVRVSYHANNAVNNLATMLPGDKISWANNQLASTKIDPKDVLAWKNELMIFRKQSLKNILSVLQKHYGVKIIVVNKGFLTENISLSINERMPLQKAMNVLAVTAGFEHSIDSLSGTVTIK